MRISVDLRPLSVCLHSRTVRTECTAKRARGGASSFGWTRRRQSCYVAARLGYSVSRPASFLSVCFLLCPAKPLTLRALIRGGVIGHAYRRAAYTSEPTNAEAPIWAAYRLPTEYPEIGVFRITDDSIYLLRTNASPKGVPGQRPHLWAFVAPSSSSMGVCVSVVLFHGGFLLPLSGCGKTPNDADSPREHGGATDSAAALPIPG